MGQVGHEMTKRTTATLFVEERYVATGKLSGVLTLVAGGVVKPRRVGPTDHQ